jgi:hypothetical protein
MIERWDVRIADEQGRRRSMVSVDNIKTPVDMHDYTDRRLGDGLYCSHDGFALWLRAPREHGDHTVALEPFVLQAFLEYAERCGVIQKREEKR